MEDREGREEAVNGIGRLRLGAVLALAAAAAFVGWLLFEEERADGPAREKTVKAASAEELEALPGSVGHPVYWAGPREGYTYELTQTPRGNLSIRYLPPGVAVEDARPDFLVVGTYPYPEAIAAARNQARRSGVFHRSIAGGGIAYSLPGKEKSVFFTYPRLDYLYEVYDPTPRRARRLVLSGRIRPIG